MTNDVFSVPRWAPVHRSTADADVKPASDNENVRLLEEFCRLMTTATDPTRSKAPGSENDPA